MPDDRIFMEFNSHYIHNTYHTQRTRASFIRFLFIILYGILYTAKLNRKTGLPSNDNFQHFLTIKLVYIHKVNFQSIFMRSFTFRSNCKSIIGLRTLSLRYFYELILYLIN
jgi:hypothetical protein